MKNILIVLFVIVIAGCATLSALKPTENNLPDMQEKVPGLTLQDAQQGFRLDKFNCSGCHDLHKPGAYTVKEWEKILPEMLSRTHINSEKDKQLIRNYLVS